MNLNDQNINSPIRVLLVDDSLLTLVILKRILSTSTEIQVVGTATNGQEALNVIPILQPDVICTDLHMPVMDGLELTREIMKKFPRPILVLSISVQKDQTSTIFQLLEAGAIEVMAKPLGEVGINYGLNAQELISKIKIIAGVKIIGRFRKELSSTKSIPFANEVPPRIIGIGASTGGPQALQEILTHLPGNLPVPIICVQHISEEFMQGLVDWLAPQCQLKITTAETGVVPQPGTVYFPKAGMQLEIDRQGKLSSTNAPVYDGHRPSVSVTFKSMAQHYGHEVTGVLLTGMGRDGVEGMLDIARARGMTIAQDEESSVVFGMPKEAIAANAVRYVLPLAKIAPTLIKLVTQDVTVYHE